jgi:hypothetical protein
MVGSNYYVQPGETQWDDVLANEHTLFNELVEHKYTVIAFALIDPRPDMVIVDYIETRLRNHGLAMQLMDCIRKERGVDWVLPRDILKSALGYWKKTIYINDADLPELKSLLDPMHYEEMEQFTSL